MQNFIGFYYNIGTVADVKFEQLLNKVLGKDIAKLLGLHQTFMVEPLHSLVNHFAPKMYSYTFTGINTAMLFTDMIFDTFREKYDFFSSGYIDDLMQEVFERCTKSRADRPEPLHESPTLASRMERPDKAQA